jgi:putative ABC transport system substrate-binding protein
VSAQIKRRAFITLLGGAAALPLARPFPALAQPSARMRRIGVLMPFVESDPDAQSWLTTFRQRLQELGWTQGQNILIEYKWGAGEIDRFPAYAADLVSSAPEVIFSSSNSMLAALQQATRTIPIVFVTVADPVGGGFAESLARPGGNITGFTNFEPSIGGKWLEVLKETAPGITRVAVIHYPETAAHRMVLRAVEAAAPSFGVAVTAAAVQDAAEIERAIAAFAVEPNGGLIVLPHPVTSVNRALIFELAARQRLPAVYGFQYIARSGGLVAYGIEVAAVYRRGAEYVDRILKGEKPANLPIQAPNKFELVINLKTAKTLGLEISPSLLARADEVIE